MKLLATLILPTALLVPLLLRASPEEPRLEGRAALVRQPPAAPEDPGLEGLEPLAGPEVARRSASAASARGGAEGGRWVAAPEELPGPRVPTDDEVALEVAPRVLESYALFQEPTDGMFSAWYGGTPLEELARRYHDGHAVLGRLGRAAAAPGEALAALERRRASFATEVKWLGEEVIRRVELPAGPVTTRFAGRGDAELARAFPTERERYGLRALMLRELYASTRDAAWGFAAARDERALPVFL